MHDDDSDNGRHQPIHLSFAQQTTLLQIARKAITHYITHGRVVQSEPSDPAFNQFAGLFVTLHLRTEKEILLRGCIGRIEATYPLHQLVPEMAIKAATKDPRFPPTTVKELPQLHIEISVLSPLKPVLAPEDIKLGKHGLLVEGYGHRGLLLPQVPLTQGWEQKEFLEGTCRKANLPPDFWRSQQAKLYTFTTLIFEEA